MEDRTKAESEFKEWLDEEMISIGEDEGLPTTGSLAEDMICFEFATEDVKSYFEFLFINFSLDDLKEHFRETYTLCLDIRSK